MAAQLTPTEQQHKEAWVKAQLEELGVKKPSRLFKNSPENHKVNIIDNYAETLGPNRSGKISDPYKDLKTFEFLKEDLVKGKHPNEAKAFDELLQKKQELADQYLQRAQGVNLETVKAREEEEKARRIAAQEQAQDIAAAQQQDPVKEAAPEPVQEAKPEPLNSIRHVKEKEQSMEEGQAALDKRSQALAEEYAKVRQQDPQIPGEKKEQEGKAKSNQAEAETEQETPSTWKNKAKSLDPFEAPQPQKDESHKAVPYKDLGDKLEADRKVPGELSGKSLAQVAKENGWKTIEVDGSAEFKQSAWREATAQGLEVKGYQPNEQDLKAVEERKGELATEAAKDKPNSIQHMAHEKTLKELIDKMSPEQQKEALEHFNKQFTERSQHKEPAQVAMSVPVQEQARNAEQEKTTNQERDR